MAGLTLRAVRSEARAISVPALALAAGDPTGTAILALDLGQKTGWAVRNADGVPKHSLGTRKKTRNRSSPFRVFRLFRG